VSFLFAYEKGMVVAQGFEERDKVRGVLFEIDFLHTCYCRLVVRQFIGKHF
jgi:hypothetical protein